MDNANLVQGCSDCSILFGDFPCMFDYRNVLGFDGFQWMILVCFVDGFRFWFQNNGGNITKNHQHLHLLPPQMPTANLKHHQQKHAYAKSIGGKHMNKSPTKRICLQTPTTQELTLRIGLLARFLFSYQVYVAIPNQDFLFFKESF